MKYTPGYILQAYAEYAYTIEDVYPITIDEINVDDNNEASFVFIAEGTCEVIDYEIDFGTIS